MKLYRGHIFSGSEDDHWIISLVQEYKHRYLRSVNELCQLLFDREEYDSVHHYAAIALALCPDSEMIYYWMYRSLKGKNWRSQAMEVLEAAEIHLSPDSNHELHRLLREET